MESLELRISDIEQRYNILSDRIKSLETAEDRRARTDVIRDWIYSLGRYFLPLGLGIATFLLGKYG